MDEKMWRYGCLFCRTGAEATIAGYINQTITDVEAVAPTRTRRKTVAGKPVEDQVKLLPGYIFFRTESDEPLPPADPYHQCTQTAGVRQYQLGTDWQR